MEKKNIKTLLVFVLALLLIIVLYLFALNNRYEQQGGIYYFDKWKQEIVEIPVPKR